MYRPAHTIGQRLHQSLVGIAETKAYNRRAATIERKGREHI